MPKTTAPLLSFGASGQIAKTVVYASWKGIPYTRRYVIPANPRTMAQTRNRSIWNLLGQIWLYLPVDVQGAFNAYAMGKPLTGRNKFYSDNQKLLVADPNRDDLTGFLFSPGANGGLPGTNLAITAGAGQLTVEMDTPTPPIGWNLVSSVAVAMPQQDPTQPFEGFVAGDVETADPGTNIVTGLEAGVEHVVGAFLVWEKPNGSMAYSISLSGVGTPT